MRVPAYVIALARSEGWHQGLDLLTAGYRVSRIRIVAPSGAIPSAILLSGVANEWYSVSSFSFHSSEVTDDHITCGSDSVKCADLGCLCGCSNSAYKNASILPDIYWEPLQIRF